MKPPRSSREQYAQWPRRGAAVGVLCGFAVAGYLEWYYGYGPGQGPDGPTAHLWMAFFLGLPVSAYGLILGRFGLALSIAVMWAVIGATIGWLAALMVSGARGEEPWFQPPAG